MWYRSVVGELVARFVRNSNYPLHAFRCCSGARTRVTRLLSSASGLVSFLAMLAGMVTRGMLLVQWEPRSASRPACEKRMSRVSL